jgi:hypothetical protein
MNLDRKMDDEHGRLAVLRQYDLPASAPKAPFDMLTERARNMRRVPSAAVSLIDADRRCFRSNAGFSASKTSRVIPFCSDVIKQLALMP